MILIKNVIRIYVEIIMLFIGCLDGFKLLILELVFFLVIENFQGNKVYSVGLKLYRDYKLCLQSFYVYGEVFIEKFMYWGI